jgi:hypothetical protein
MTFNAYLVELRTASEGVPSNLLSLWFEDSAHRNCILSRGENLWWGTSESHVRSVAARVPEFSISDKPADLIDVSQVRQDLLAPTVGAEGRVLTCLSFLDDLCIQLDVIQPPACIHVVDQAVDLLTFGGTLDSLFVAVGGVDIVKNSLSWFLGCVLARSCFD